MKTSTKRLVVLLMLLCMLLSSISSALADDDDWYTYTYSYWGEEMASPNAYAVTNIIYIQIKTKEYINMWHSYLKKLFGKWRKIPKRRL